MTDVLDHPSLPGLARRRVQLDRDRLRLLAQMELEQLVDHSPPPRPRPPEWEGS